jgi:hypothetical protein
MHVPCVADIPHQERTIELSRTEGKALLVFKETRLHLSHLERLDLPVLASKL